MNGSQLAADIYIGPTYYMRLKHMVKDKINYRARGPNTALTRQPVQGRANDGGLRIGEMERDGVLAHGMSYFLNESFMVRGEKKGKRGEDFYIAICNKTGSIAIYNESRNLFLSPFADGPIQFVTNPTDGTQSIMNLSRFGRSFSILRVPYAFKLLMQELQVMNVQMRIVTEDNVDQLMNMSYSNNISKLLQSDKSDKETIDSYNRIVKNIVANAKRSRMEPQNFALEEMSVFEPANLDTAQELAQEQTQTQTQESSPQFKLYDTSEMQEPPENENQDQNQNQTQTQPENIQKTASKIGEQVMNFFSNIVPSSPQEEKSPPFAPENPKTATTTFKPIVFEKKTANQSILETEPVEKETEPVEKETETAKEETETAKEVTEGQNNEESGSTEGKEDKSNVKKIVTFS